MPRPLNLKFKEGAKAGDYKQSVKDFLFWYYRNLLLCDKTVFWSENGHITSQVWNPVWMKFTKRQHTFWLDEYRSSLMVLRRLSRKKHRGLMEHPSTLSKTDVPLRKHLLSFLFLDSQRPRRLGAEVVMLTRIRKTQTDWMLRLLWDGGQEVVTLPHTTRDALVHSKKASKKNHKTVALLHCPLNHFPKHAEENSAPRWTTLMAKPPTSSKRTLDK